jgi:CRP-like cAMP-binding protein
MKKCDCELCDLKNLFFSRLNPEEVELYCSGKIEKEYAKGEVIIKEGHTIGDFIYLRSGLVKLFHTDNQQKEQIITIAKPFDYVSLLSVFSNKNYNYSVTAIEDAVTCNLDMTQIRELILSNGNYAMGLIEKMSAVSDRIILESLEIRKRHLRGRVAYLLIYFHDQVYQNAEFGLPLSRKEIGEYVGMTTENVIRTLSEFRKDKTISINGKVIEIRDIKTLRSISTFG